MVNYGIDARMIFDTSGKNLDGVNASLTDMQKLPISQSFTATDGQTLFTLSNSYTVGNKEVFVTVDGVPQFSGSGFSESSSTSITLSEGAQTGAKVIVTIYQTPSGVNSTLTDVQSSLAQKAQQYHVDVDSFKIQTPEVDDTARIQRALDSVSSNAVIEFPINKTLNISSDLTITNKTNYRITGARLQLSGSMTRAFVVVGTLDNIEIDHCWINGDGVVANQQKGIQNNSGQTVTHFRYHHNFISNVTIAISLNADLSGTYDSGSVDNNFIYNIVGDTSGYGYGIHTANGTNVVIAHNTIDSCQRHSIYQAKGGRGNKIIFNTILNHRKTNAAALYRPAINCIRSSGVLIMGNTFKDCYDCCLIVGGDSPGGFACSDIDVINNKVINPQNNVAPFMIGEQILATSLIDGARFLGNKVMIDTWMGGSIFKFYNGKNIEIANNYMVINGITQSITGIELNDSYVTDNNQADNLNFHDNTFDFEGTTFGTSKGHHIGTKYAGGTMNIEVRNNTYRNSSNYTPVYFASANANTNLSYGTKKFTQNYANTSGATLTALETEVNNLKQAMRDLGLMKSI